MKNRDILNLELINEAANKISTFISDLNTDAFLKDYKSQSAVILQLIVIGELAKKLPDETKAKIDLPWKLISGFRDLAVHEYFELDLRQVWETVLNDIPTLIKKISEYKINLE